MSKSQLRILCPNGHLGFAPTKEGSFRIGAATKPDYYCCDSGSDDIGPAPLGADKCASMYEWQKHDLELMLLAAREQGVPMIVGSAGDTGSNSRVDMYVQIIKDLAKEHNLPKFKLAYFYSEVDKKYLQDKMKKGIRIEGLDGRQDLSINDLEKTDRIVAVAGVHPYIKALQMGADVIIGGRSSDCAVFAAPAIKEGFSEDLAYYLGKVLECASFCAEPYGAKETVIGTITENDVRVTAMHPDQRCTIASVAGHAMYERSNPFYEYVAGGMLDMTNCKYEQYDEKTCRITGSVFVPIEGKVKVKLEGAGKVGEKYIGIAGIRDPYTIENIDKVIEWCKQQVEEKFTGKEYYLDYKIFGKNGVMGDLEPIKEIKSHELCVIVEGVAPTKEMAEEVTLTGTRQIFYARLPEVKGTAGTAAFVVDEVLPATPAYTWTLNHVIPVDDPMELFDVKLIEVGN
ncbi:acyclic terpene utilization AtuA family protein [Effusibacillus lacus]|uniref:Glutamate mutase n=1 Tax=Effusibacillus lacus TaxID=1348429 RepID=A0A292YIU2_9BACL|nr:acyclic terpene utilization AtuA family protein [Effusibacillus lacus]TCS68593.1 1-deoxy-D-xylulose 5-phosphate reductoisomerase [Effusibacillus lacus]GAX88819.1 glutamate mutase [Effusibacillus lacus]